MKLACRTIVFLLASLALIQACAKSPEQRQRDAAVEESKRVFVLSDNPKVEADIREISGTHGWKWKSQHTDGLIPTGNPSAPYVMTVTVMFAHPTDQHVRRVLTWTWVYADITWHPLALELWDSDTQEKKSIRRLRDWAAWRGERAS